MDSHATVNFVRRKKLMQETEEKFEKGDCPGSGTSRKKVLLDCEVHLE